MNIKHLVTFAIFTLVVVVTVAGCGEGGDPGPADLCTVRVRYTGTEPSEQATISIDYTDVVGSFGEPLQATTCHSVSRGIETALLINFCDHDCSQGEQRVLSMQLFTGQSGDAHSINGPADIVRCEFFGDALTLPNLRFLRADFLKGDNTPTPDAGAELVTECGQRTSTTTTSTTSTTESPDGKNVVVEIQIGDATGLGALQFHASYPCSAGDFEPLNSLGNAIRCDRGDLPVDLWATNELSTGEADHCVRKATFGIVSTDGFDGPGTVLRCPFHASDDSIDSSIFGVQIVDATDTFGHAQNVDVSLEFASEE